MSFNRLRWMTDEEYEQKYQAALVQLNAKGYTVGLTETLDDFRFCWVNQQALNDEEVFERAWGAEVAAKMIERRGD